MVNERVAFYRADPNRSKRAFEDLIADWQGILISDSYGVIPFVGQRPPKLPGTPDPKSKRPFAKKRSQTSGALATSSQLHFKSFPISRRRHRAPMSGPNFIGACYLPFRCMKTTRATPAGWHGKSCVKSIPLWTFLEHEGVEPTNNRAERALRFAVLWRKRSLGTQSEKGNRWVERILSLKETCRLQAKSTFQVLLDCIRAYLSNSAPDLAWI